MTDKPRHLKIENLGYSVNPWRITCRGIELFLMGFKRKSDAVPFALAIEQIGDVNEMMTWNDDQRNAYRDLAKTTDSYRIHRAGLEASHKMSYGGLSYR